MTTANTASSSGPAPPHLPPQQLSQMIAGPGVAEFFFPDPEFAFQSLHAAYSISANASLSGLSDPSNTKLSGLTTGESQPSDVKCGVFANGEEADAATGVGEADEEDEEEEEEEEESAEEDDDEG